MVAVLNYNRYLTVHDFQHRGLYKLKYNYNLHRNFTKLLVLPAEKRLAMIKLHLFLTLELLHFCRKDKILQ